MANYAQGTDYQAQQADLQKKLNEKQQQLQQFNQSADQYSLSPIGTVIKNLGSQLYQPGITQSQQALEASQKEAQYAKDLAQYTEALRTGSEGQARRDLASNMAGVKRDTSARGLLHSGIKQSQDVGAINQAAAQTAGGAAQAAQTYRDKLAGYRGEQVNRGLDEYQLAQQKAAADYNTALQKRKQVQEQNKGLAGALGSIGGAAGAIGGALL